MKKPSLADLAAKKPAAAATENSGGTVANPAGEGRGRASSQVDGRKGILVRVAPEGWRQLRDLAAELTLAGSEQVSMQSLIVDAINETLKRHGRPPLA